MNCIILGDHSDIAMALKPLLEADGWSITGWNRSLEAEASPSWPRKSMENFPKWNLVICAIGTVAPVGHWASQNADEWDHCVESNVLLPIRLLRTIWARHEPDASVCFMAGANPNRAGPNYSAYYTGKMALLKAVETIDAETPDAKFFCLAPGIVFTKIHNATMESGIINQGLEDRRKVGGTPIPKIYDCLKWCVSQPKEVVGGRNICCSDDYNSELSNRLRNESSIFKLRRIE